MQSCAQKDTYEVIQDSDGWWFFWVKQCHCRVRESISFLGEHLEEVGCAVGSCLHDSCRQPLLWHAHSRHLVLLLLLVRYLRLLELHVGILWLLDKRWSLLSLVGALFVPTCCILWKRLLVINLTLVLFEELRGLLRDWCRQKFSLLLLIRIWLSYIWILLCVELLLLPLKVGCIIVLKLILLWLLNEAWYLLIEGLWLLDYLRLVSNISRRYLHLHIIKVFWGVLALIICLLHALISCIIISLLTAVRWGLH